MERILHVVTISVLAFFIQSHWKVQNRTDTYVEYYLALNWTVEDMKEEMESKTAEYVTKYMQIESNKMDEKNSKMMEENFTQMRTKMIQLEATISQQNDNDKSQIQIRKELETKVKQMETKINYQELLIFALKSQRPTTESEFNSQFKPLGNSFSGESRDFRTCHGLRSVDPFLPSGMYWIDPDGKGVGEDPIYVFCNMTTGTTSVSHDSELPMNVGHCAGIGCYSRNISYIATMEQISSLAKYSAECHQSIRYDCISAPFETNNIAYGWWNDKNGSAKYFWSGVDDEDNQHICQCGIDENCVDPDVKCNCDSMNPVQLFDSGVITDKNLLPITGLNFGRTLLETSSGVHTLGSFECSGQVTTVMPSSCEDLWRMGHTLSGLYSVVGPVHIETVFCDFQKRPDQKEFQKWIGFADVKSTPTFFYVCRSVEFYEAGVPIPFDYVVLNTGNVMDLSTGIFTATQAGTYFFTFAGIARFPAESSLQSFGISLHLNDDLLVAYDGLEFNDLRNEHRTTLTSQSMLELKPGDQICLKFSSNSQKPNLFMITYFIGWMLEEKMSESLGFSLRDD